MKSNIKYGEISKAQITDTRNVVISTCSKGGFTIAQQLMAKEGGEKTTTVFLRGAFHVDDIQGLYNLRDATNLAIQTAENAEEEQSDWDE